MAGEIYDEASAVDAVRGDVHMKGPDGVDIVMTPEAAAETSDRLLAGSAKAQGQRILDGRRYDERRRSI